MLAYWDAVRDREAIQRWLTIAPPVDPTTATNHFNQCNGRNRAQAYMSLGLYSKAQPLLTGLQAVAEQVGLKTDLNRNHIALALLYWDTEDRENALKHMVAALQLPAPPGPLASCVRARY